MTSFISKFGSEIANGRTARLVLTAFLLAAPVACSSGSKSSGTAHNAPPVGAPLPDSEKDVIRPRKAATSTELNVKHGNLPFRYLITQQAVVRVNDVTANRQLLRHATAPNTIVNVNAKEGVKLNDAVLVPGPLDQGHKYEIIVER